jgi:hypothetical protein
MLISRYAIHPAAAGLVLAAAGSSAIAEARPADGSTPTVQFPPPAPTSVPIERAADCHGKAPRPSETAHDWTSWTVHPTGQSSAPTSFPPATRSAHAKPRSSSREICTSSMSDAAQNAVAHRVRAGTVATAQPLVASANGDVPAKRRLSARKTLARERRRRSPCGARPVDRDSAVVWDPEATVHHVPVHRSGSLRRRPRPARAHGVPPLDPHASLLSQASSNPPCTSKSTARRVRSHVGSPPHASPGRRRS